MLLHSTMPGGASWAKAHPPGARSEARAFAPGWDPGYTVPGRVVPWSNGHCVWGFLTTFCLAPHPGPNCLGRPH